MVRKFRMALFDCRSSTRHRYIFHVPGHTERGKHINSHGHSKELSIYPWQTDFFFFFQIHENVLVQCEYAGVIKTKQEVVDN